MANLDRRTQKIFGSSATPQQISAFGTAKNNNPTYVTNLNTGMDAIQNNTFLQGWTPSLVDDLAPFLEDSNGLWYMITRQLAYLYQDGIAEYDANTNYKIGSLVKVIASNGAVTIYRSLINDNIGNSTTNSNYWKVYISEASNLATYEIGLPQFTLRDYLLPNEVWLEGQAVYRNTYVNLFNIYGTKYGSGNGSTTFNLPDFRNRTLWGTSAGSYGYISAGLPNITGTFEGASQNSNYTTGAFYVIGRNTKVSNDGKEDNTYGFDASRSSSIYGRSSTVQPPAIKVRVKTRYY